MAGPDPIRPPAPTHSRYYPRDPERLDEGVLPWISMAEALERAKEAHWWIMAAGVTGCGRPRPDTRPAPTITAQGKAYVTDNQSVYGSQLGPNCRRVAVDEALVLQGFPRDFGLHGSKTSQFRQIGNAVNPPVAAAVIRSLLGGPS